MSVVFPANHIESNYGMVRKRLFPTGIPKDYVVTKMEVEASD